MLCCITGSSPEEPVVSKKTGHLFEKRVVQKYITQYNKCPVTDGDLGEDDLLEVKCSKAPKPRPAQASSIPGMLSLFQNEWDSLMIDSYTMKGHLDTTRQELAHSLYQHDAACRVIARLVKERDGIKAQLSNFSARVEESKMQAKAEADAEMAAAEEEGKIPKNVISKLQETSALLTNKRKRRQISDSLATPEDIDRFDQLTSFTPHSAADPGVLCLDVNLKCDNSIVTGGNDGVAIVYDREAGQIAAKLSGHTKPIRRVLLHPSSDHLFTGSDDCTVRMWKKQDTGLYKTEFLVKDHAASIRGLTLNATNDYLVTASLDNTWNFYDIETGSCLSGVNAAEVGAGSSSGPVQRGFTCATFHPDGMILGTGTGDSTVCIWDLTTLSNVASFEGHLAPVTCVTFSENGYYLATSSTDGTVKMWDLRKLINFRTLTFEDSNPTNPTHVNSVKFDASGNYLAVAADNVKCYSVKTWNELKVLYNHTSSVTDVAWGPDAKWMVSTSMDRHVKVYASN